MMMVMTEQLGKRKSSGLTQDPGLSCLIPKLANVTVYKYSTNSHTAIHLKQLMAVVIPRFGVNYPEKKLLSDVRYLYSLLIPIRLPIMNTKEIACSSLRLA